MRFQEPLDLECPHCKANFQATVSQIRQAGQVCPTCHGDLISVRASIESVIDSWRLVCNSTGIALSLERQFPVEFSDDDLEQVRTIGDIIEVTRKLLERGGREDNRDKIEEEVVRVIRHLSSVQLDAITPETKLLDLGSIPIFGDEQMIP